MDLPELYQMHVRGDVEWDDYRDAREEADGILYDLLRTLDKELQPLHQELHDVEMARIRRYHHDDSTGVTTPHLPQPRWRSSGVFFCLDSLNQE